MGHDSALFWTKLNLPNGQAHCASSQLTITEKDEALVTLARPQVNRFLPILPASPLPAGTMLTLSYDEEGIFELWTAELESLVHSASGLDSYAIKDLRLEMTSSERRTKRLILECPIQVASRPFQNSPITRIWKFAGLDLNASGLGLWLPKNFQKKVTVGMEFEIIFQLGASEEETLALKATCPREPFLDNIGKGICIGLKFEELTAEQSDVLAWILSNVAHPRELNPTQALHPLAGFWLGEFFATMR